MCAERRREEALLAHSRACAVSSCGLRPLGDQDRSLIACSLNRLQPNCSSREGKEGKAVRPKPRLTDSPAPPPLTPWQASPASRNSSVCEEVKDAKVEDAKVEDAKVEDGKDGEDKDGEDKEDETLNTPPQDAPASLLAAFSEEADEMDAGCAETAGALGRAEAGGADWAWQAEEGEDAGEEEKARGPAALLLTDVDLRGLEFSEQVGPLSAPPLLS
jgi:hypothetical protein